MLIIHSVKNRIIQSGKIFSGHCASCGKLNTSEIQIRRKYFTLFWIPVFPLKKKYTVVCTDCGRETPVTHLNVSLQLEAENIGRNAKTPAWMWTGSFLSAALVLITVFIITNHQAEIKALAKDPQAGDIYVVRNQPGYYFLKIILIDNNNIHVVSSKRVVKLKEIDEVNLNDQSAFYDKEFIVHRNVLWKMYKENRIYDIIRKKNPIATNE